MRSITAAGVCVDQAEERNQLEESVHRGKMSFERGGRAPGIQTRRTIPECLEVQMTTGASTNGTRSEDLQDVQH